MQVSPARRQFIADLANDEWIDRLDDDVRNDEAAFGALCKEMDEKLNVFLISDAPPDELHLFAEFWNWDCGPGPLEKIATHPNCDAGTALLIYWRGRPEWFLQYPVPDLVPPHEQELFNLICLVERRYLANAYQTALIRYDPRADGAVGPYTSIVNDAGRRLPERMYLAVGMPGPA